MSFDGSCYCGRVEAYGYKKGDSFILFLLLCDLQVDFFPSFFGKNLSIFDDISFQIQRTRSVILEKSSK